VEGVDVPGRDAGIAAPVVERTSKLRPDRGRHVMARVARPRVAGERRRATSGRGGGRLAIGPEPRRAGGTGTHADTVCQPLRPRSRHT